MPHLSVGEFLGQLPTPGQLGQRLEDGHAVGDAAADDGIGAFGRDETLKDDAVLLHPFANDLQTVGGAVAVVTVTAHEVGVVGTACGYHLKALGVHGLDDVGVVVVERKGGAIAVESVADVPLLGLRKRHLDAEGVVVGSDVHEETLLHADKEQPVGIGRVVTAQTLYLLDIALLGEVVEGFPKCVVAAVERFDEIGGIDQCLPAAGPPEVVGRSRIDGVGVGLQRPLAELATLLPLGGVVVGQG